VPVADSSENLVAMGFRGFVKLCYLREVFYKVAPAEPGTFAILRRTDTPVSFVEVPEKPLAPQVWRISAKDLKSRWVSGVPVVYLGDAGPGRREPTIRKAIRRLYTPSEHQTSPLTHDGQLVWYIRGAEELEAAWCVNASESLESILFDFAEIYKRLPFANSPAA